jgi:hypothetical protein
MAITAVIMGRVFRSALATVGTMDIMVTMGITVTVATTVTVGITVTDTTAVMEEADIMAVAGMGDIMAAATAEASML